MATLIQIMCINKSDRTAIHERIKYVGGHHAGKHWKLSLDDAVQGVKNKLYDFFVQFGSTRVKVIVAKSAAGYEYLKTENDSTTSNNLLMLREC
jgi:Protein of unknown function (DUF3892)